MKIQAYLTAAAINLNRLAAYVAAQLWALAGTLINLVASAARKNNSSLRWASP